MHLHRLGLPQTLLASPDWIAAQTPAAWLTEHEMRRSNEFAAPTRRRDWQAGRLAAKRLLHDEWAIAPRTCAVGTDGIAPRLDAPGLENINWSLSHSAGWGAASWADTHAQGTVGIDIQQIRAVHAGLAARILGEQECVRHTYLQIDLGHDEAILLVWALKEAAIKARRLPWGRALSSIHVQITSAHTAQISLPDEPQMFSASYLRHGSFWVARALRPPSLPPPVTAR